MISGKILQDDNQTLEQCRFHEYDLVTCQRTRGKTDLVGRREIQKRTKCRSDLMDEMPFLLLLLQPQMALVKAMPVHRIEL